MLVKTLVMFSALLVGVAVLSVLFARDVRKAKREGGERG